MNKRIAAALLCLMMAFTILPLSSSAEDEAQPQADTYTITFHRNDGSDNPVYQTITAAQGETITFPEGPTRTGYVFTGWYNAASGGERLDDDTDTDTYTVQGDATLYARWMDERFEKQIGIGINLYYHCEGYNYWYPDSSTSSPSYQRYPNEPTRIYHATLRAGKDNDTWKIYYNKEDFGPDPYNRDYYGIRLGDASKTVSLDFFTSPDAVQVYGSTVGIADPTGSKVKAMLNLTEADYDAIAAAWIAWAKDTSNGFTATAAGDYFDGWSHHAKSSIDWSGVDASQYTAVPYVVKYQGTDNVWFIDMVIRPKIKYTLGYDRNLDEGFSLPDNTKFPETSTHDPGEMVNIVGNPNVTPTNGAGATATFLYWVDKDGNKYGNGYTMTIPMFEDKVLYAIWNYSDNPQFGDVRITKEVTNLNSDVVDTSDPGFEMTITLTDGNNAPVAGEFTYTIYNGASAPQGSGTLVNGGKFQLKDTWYIIIKDLPKDTQVTITETDVNEYLARNSPKTITVVAGHTTLAIMKNIYAHLPYGIRWYTVEHYFQNELGNYDIAPDFEERIQVHQDITTWTNAQAKTHPLFTLDTEKHPGGIIKQEEIATNGSTVIEIYYARAKYPYLVRYLDQNTNQPVREADRRDPQIYLSTVTETAPEIPGYTLVSSPEQSCTIAAETDTFTNNVITFYYTENDVTLQYRVVGPTGCGTVSRASETVKAVTGSAAGSTATENQGFKFVGWYEDEACTKPVGNTDHLDPQTDRAAGTPYTAATYYAKFECIVGSLSVTKNVTKAYAGDVIPENDTFAFTVSLTPVTGAFENGRTYPYTVKVGETTVDSGYVNHADYQITFSLKNGETAVISGLPLGGYQVEEANHADYTLKSSENISGTIEAGKTAVALFNNEYTRHRGNLTITKANAADPEQVFVYEVKHNTTGEIITVTVTGNGSATIYDLFVGDYTVTQKNDWSWRYNDPAQSATVVAGETVTATFGNGVADNQWLDGNSPLIKNRYREDSAA